MFPAPLRNSFKLLSYPALFRKFAVRALIVSQKDIQLEYASATASISIRNFPRRDSFF